MIAISMSNLKIEIEEMQIMLVKYFKFKLIKSLTKINFILYQRTNDHGVIFWFKTI